MAKEPSKNHPQSFFLFWGEAIKKGWNTSEEKLGRFLTWLAIISPIILFGIIQSSKNSSPDVEANREVYMNRWEAFIPFGVWLIWFIVHVLKAPYEICKEQFQQHELEIGEKKQKIHTLETEIESLQSVNKRRFLAFMAQLRAEIDNVKPENWTEFFRNKIPNIKHEVALIEDNFKPKDQDSFQFWVNNLCEIAVECDSSIINVVNMKIDFLCNFVKNPPNFP